MLSRGICNVHKLGCKIKFILVSAEETFFFSICCIIFLPFEGNCFLPVICFPFIIIICIPFIWLSVRGIYLACFLPCQPCYFICFLLVFWSVLLFCFSLILGSTVQFKMFMSNVQAYIVTPFFFFQEALEFQEQRVKEDPLETEGMKERKALLGHLRQSTQQGKKGNQVSKVQMP